MRGYYNKIMRVFHFIGTKYGVICIILWGSMNPLKQKKKTNDLFILIFNGDTKLVISACVWFSSVIAAYRTEVLRPWAGTPAHICPPKQDKWITLHFGSILKWIITTPASGVLAISKRFKSTALIMRTFRKWSSFLHRQTGIVANKSV